MRSRNPSERSPPSCNQGPSGTAWAPEHTLRRTAQSSSPDADEKTRLFSLSRDVRTRPVAPRLRPPTRAAAEPRHLTCRTGPGGAGGRRGAQPEVPEVQRGPEHARAQQHQPVSHWPPPPAPPRAPAARRSLPRPGRERGDLSAPSASGRARARAPARARNRGRTKRCVLGSRLWSGPQTAAAPRPEPRPRARGLPTRSALLALAPPSSPRARTARLPNGWEL